MGITIHGIINYRRKHLGKNVSGGCIRIPNSFNNFIDTNGLLDTHGKYLVVADSRIQKNATQRWIASRKKT